VSGLRITTSLAPTLPTRKPSKDASAVDPEAIHKAAVSLESFMLDQVLKEVRGGSMVGDAEGGFAGGTFREMLDQALSQKMAERGALGLAPMLEAKLGGNPEKTAHFAPPHHTAALGTEAAPAASPLVRPSSSRPVGR